MAHYPGHYDEAPPSTTDWAATNPNYKARTRLPTNLPTLPSTVVYQPSRPRVPDRIDRLEQGFIRGPKKDASGRLVYPAIPAGPLLPGASWEQVPGGYVYVPPSATTSGTNGNMSGVNTDFSKITNADQQKRQEFRTNYMMGLGPLQEGIRQARVGGTQSSDLLRSQLAQTAIGGFGGISGGAEQQVLDAARGKEGQYIEQKANLYADYISNLLGVDKQTADAIAKEAVKRASKLAGAEKAYLQRVADELLASYKGLGGN